MDFNLILSKMKVAAKGAGAKIMEVFHEDEKQWQIETKSDDSPVTKADLQSNAYLKTFLKTEFPEIGYVSEESALPSYEERQSYEYYFLIDPLDGTAAFVKKSAGFSVNIALIHKDTPIAGCVYFPITGHIYYALKGEGAFFEKGSMVFVEKLIAAQFSPKAEGLRVLCSQKHHNQATQDFIEALNAPQATAASASLKFMKIASGEADIYPRFAAGMKEWDVAASQIIVEEAGGIVFDPYTKEKLKYNKRELGTPNFIAIGQIIDNTELPFPKK